MRIFIFSVSFVALLGLSACHGQSSSTEPAASPAMASSSGGEQSAATAPAAIGFPNEHHPAPGLITGGAPTAAELARAQKQGVLEVISLQTLDEPGADKEQQTVESLGMAFVRLPIAGPDDVTKANADKLDQDIADAGDRTIYLHCASGNRAGALLALRAYYFENKSVPEALAFGRSAGMTGLEPVVKKQLEEACQAAPSRCGPSSSN